ncbi:hypothetical protein [Arthrobacter sp. efr-133-TYG-118]|uniref:hypothetical protein n=1 Tax=Arthrobacter sp. efr-133-TYG-118 TaxID=3040279 RepID=UPI00254D1CF1|nr:hypothetical protein [Arthrobacter sp. efr-133-TYG-118]
MKLLRLIGPYLCPHGRSIVLVARGDSVYILFAGAWMLGITVLQRHVGAAGEPYELRYRSSPVDDPRRQFASAAPVGAP